MLYTEEQSNTILENPKNLTNQFEKNEVTSQVQKKAYGGGPHKFNMDERVLIGTLARAGLGNSMELSAEFNLSHDQVNNLKQGRTSAINDTHYKPNLELEERILGKMNDVSNRAIEVLMNSLGVITPEKLSEVSAKDASVIASNASRVIQNCAPQVQQDNKINVIMYAPRVKEINEYKVVDI